MPRGKPAPAKAFSPYVESFQITEWGSKKPRPLDRGFNGVHEAGAGFGHDIKPELLTSWAVKLPAFNVAVFPFLVNGIEALALHR